MVECLSRTPKQRVDLGTSRGEGVCAALVVIISRKIRNTPAHFTTSTSKLAVNLVAGYNVRV